MTKTPDLLPTEATPDRGSAGGIERLGGVCALAASAASFIYAVSFVILPRIASEPAGLLSPLFLMLAGLLATPLLVALYERLRATDQPVALLGLLLGAFGAIGGAVHGGYDLANAINPPPAPVSELPNQSDPRGLLTFGVAGLGWLVLSSLIARGAALPRGLGLLGYLFGALLLTLYLARLTVLTPPTPSCSFQCC